MQRQYRRLPAVMGACVLAVLLALNSRPASAQITVTSATPNNAPQGTINLNVTVGGKGFNKGAKATWYVGGTTDTGGVTVNSTTFVSSSQLVANITVADTATVSGYDVVVHNTSGRTGVGSDLFTINPEVVTSYVYSTDASNSFAVQGDGLDPSSSGASTYTNTPSNCSLGANSTCTLMSLLPNDWYLRIQNQTSRTIRLTFLALGSSPDESALDGPYPAQLATRCFDAKNNWMSIPLTIPPGTSNNRCSLRVDFFANGTRYLYIMSPLYAGTGWSTVACTSGSASESCNAWTVTPTLATSLPNHSLANLANLYTVAKSGKMTLVGTYTMTFSVALTQP